MILKHEFVEYIPDDLTAGTVYISIVYKTALHKCVCGCGIEVVTPISPTDWQLTFNGESISLHPSIGNWSFPCRSHYWIKNGEVVWAPSWSREEIEAGRKQDALRKKEYYATRPSVDGAQEEEVTDTQEAGNVFTRIWNWIWKK